MPEKFSNTIENKSKLKEDIKNQIESIKEDWLIDFVELEKLNKILDEEKKDISINMNIAMKNFIESTLFYVTERSVLIKNKSDINLLKKYWYTLPEDIKEEDLIWKTLIRGWFNRYLREIELVDKIFSDLDKEEINKSEKLSTTKTDWNYLDNILLISESNFSWFEEISKESIIANLEKILETKNISQENLILLMNYIDLNREKFWEKNYKVIFEYSSEILKKLIYKFWYIIKNEKDYNFLLSFGFNLPDFKNLKWKKLLKEFRSFKIEEISWKETKYEISWKVVKGNNWLTTTVASWILGYTIHWSSRAAIWYAWSTYVLSKILNSWSGLDDASKISIIKDYINKQI